MAVYVVTGGAGFIGSHLVEALLRRGDSVRVLDDFSTGTRRNLEHLCGDLDCVEGSIVDAAKVASVMRDAEACFHLAASPSVPRSIADPANCNAVNVGGTVNVFLAARDAGVRRVVYASSSSVYGNAECYPVEETLPRQPLSPYAVSKAAGELYAESFARLYGMQLVGLRYFNVFGPRQDPNGAYAAVIPRFIHALLKGEAPTIFGDGEHARDFTAVDNVAAANLLAADLPGALNGVYNIACGRPITLLELAEQVAHALGVQVTPQFAPEREGDIRLSWANIHRAHDAFGYVPNVTFEAGLQRTVAWFREAAR